MERRRAPHRQHADPGGRAGPVRQEQDRHARRHGHDQSDAARGEPAERDAAEVPGRVGGPAELAKPLEPQVKPGQRQGGRNDGDDDPDRDRRRDRPVANEEQPGLDLGRLEGPDQGGKPTEAGGRHVRVGDVALHRLEGDDRSQAPPEHHDERQEQDDLHVAADDRLGERRPGEDERDPDPWDRQATDRQDPCAEADRQPGRLEGDLGDGQERRDERQAERRVEERLGRSRRGAERRCEIRLSAVQPAIRRSERDLEVDAEGVDEQEVVEQRPADDRDRDPREAGPQQSVGPRTDLQDHRQPGSHRVSVRTPRRWDASYQDCRATSGRGRVRILSA